MNHKLFRVLATCAVLVLAGFALPALAEDIKGEALSAMISGKTLSGYNIDDRKNVVWYFAPDGLVKMRKKNITWPGKWRIDETGRLCVQFQDPYSNVPKKEGCRILSREDDKLVMYGLTKDGLRAGETMSIESITDGNTENL